MDIERYIPLPQLSFYTILSFYWNKMADPSYFQKQGFNTDAKSRLSAIENELGGTDKACLGLVERCVYEACTEQSRSVDPLKCPKCGGTMKIVSFIEKNQSEVIERY
jgi:hypothetical protein